MGAENHGGGVLELVFEPALKIHELAFGQFDGAVEIRLGQAEGAEIVGGILGKVLADASGQPHAHPAGSPLAANAMGAALQSVVAEERGLGRGSGFGLRGAVEAHEQMGVFDHAGQLGGNDAESLDVVGGEVIPLGILDDDHADGIHFPLNRHGEKGEIGFFAAPGNVLEGGMIGGLGLADRAHFLQGGPGDAFAQLETQVTDQARIQSLVGPENQFAGLGFIEIDRTDRGAHVPGHGGHNAGQKRVEAGFEIKEADDFADVAHQRHVVFLEIAHGRSDRARSPAGKRQGLDFAPKKSTFKRVFNPSARWCNGSTADSGSVCLGSNPSRATIFGTPPPQAAFGLRRPSVQVTRMGIST